MIRKAIIVLLSVLSVATAIIFAGSFAGGQDGIFGEVIEMPKSMAIVRAHRGGVSFYLLKVEPLTPPDLPFMPEGSPEIDATYRDVNVQLKASQKLMLVSVEKLSWLQRDGSNLFRFGFAAPSPNMRSAPMLAPDMGFLAFPLWVPLLLFATYPAIALIRGPLRRRARRRRNECVQCGYNMTGNESGVCPECGEAICHQPHEV